MSAELKLKAEALGITVPGNWGDKRIQEEIDRHNAGQRNGNGVLDPGQGSTTQQAPVSPNAPPPPVSGITPGDTPQPIVEDPEPTKKEKQVEILLKADFWPEEGERKMVGEKVTVGLGKAKQLIGAGKAEIPLED
ncbi:hypothetical protein ACQKKX_02375 [Neorhizobium sp. NPDC001467]|uniref:hypothetical protein n=1 Tax=Neorhizobium sp. NPDC001467 TaxID=3390595 RepID=UPI003CFEDE2D